MNNVFNINELRDTVEDKCNKCFEKVIKAITFDYCMYKRGI